MTGFGLLLGHLVGDYIFQTDWMAANKSNPHPGIDPLLDLKGKSFAMRLPGGGTWQMQSVSPSEEDRVNWALAVRNWWIGHVACAVHCLLYTAAVALFSFWWMPWWGYVACFAVHWPIDRWRLARAFMRYTQHEAFASGPLSPWSIILTGNILHLLTLWAIAACSMGV